MAPVIIKWLQWCASVVAQAVPKRNLLKMCVCFFQKSVNKIYPPKAKAELARRTKYNVSREKKKEKNSISNVQNVFIFFRRVRVQFCNVQNVFICFFVGLGYNYAYNNAYTTGKNIHSQKRWFQQGQMSRFWYQ